MAVRAIAPGIDAIIAEDWDRRLFDELIPLPEGTSYNAYLVRGSEKTALIDTTDPRTEGRFAAYLSSLGGRIDYVVSNHSEQDHSGALPLVLRTHPEAKVIASAKAAQFLPELLAVDRRQIETVDDGATISLGNRTLQFLSLPWVHWPETMATWIPEDRILFPCDLFGSHLATSDLYADDQARVLRAAKTYYAQIMMPFRPLVRKHLQRLSALDIAVIAPSHGPVHRRPELILQAYRDWTNDQVANTVTLPYVSMHGSVRAMVDHVTEALIAKGVSVFPFNLTGGDTGTLAVSLVDAATVVIGTPTVLGGPHPAAISAVTLLNALRPKTRFVSVIGSYCWAGRIVEQITGLLTAITPEVIPPVIARGRPKQADLSALDELAETIACRHRDIGATTGGTAIP